MLGRSRCFVSLTLALSWLSVSPAYAATIKACGAIVHPYPNTRFADVSITRIRAKGVTCSIARQVAMGAHYKALGITPPISGIRQFTWHGWRVTGDLRPTSDRYTATRGAARVTWRF